MPKERTNEAKWYEVKNHWRIDVKRDGVRKSFYSSEKGRKGKLEAERKADLWLTEGSTEDIRFKELWEKYLARAKETTGTGNYQNHEGVGRLYLIPHLGNIKVSTITQQMMQECIDKAYKKGLSRKSLLNIRASLTAVYTYARKSRIAMERPDAIDIPRDAPVGERNILQPDELNILFTKDSCNIYGAAKKRHYIYAWRFLVLTGLRPGELYGLRHEDISNGIVRIRRARNIEGEETKGKNDNARRWFAIPSIAQTILDDQAKMLKEAGIISPWVFPDESGEQSYHHHVYKTWIPYRKQHGINSSLYELRHTMISIVAADLPEKLLKSVVGHSQSMDTLGVYAHEVDGDAKRASKIIDDVFRRVLKNTK